MLPSEELSQGRRLGKSWAVRTKAKLMALKYPGIRILIVRRTYPELINNHINILRAELLGIAKYNDKDKILKFTNGSTINFTYCAKDGDLDRLQGVEYDVIFLDEATQLSEYQMKAITACIRGVNAFPKRCYYTANPGGQGHAYIKRLFIDRRYNDDENPDDYEFIQSLVTDNKALMQSQPEYIDQLKALPHKLREAWLYGKWDIFEGQFFEEFTDDPKHYGDHKWSHVIEPFEINGSYKIYRSFDWGYARPFSVGWYAVSSDDVIYRFLEWYGCTGEPNVGVKKDAHEVFKHIAEIERTHPWLKGQHIIGVADPAIWQEDGGESIAQTAEKYRVYFNKADHNRIPGWMQCHYRLRFDENGKAMFHVFKTCKDFIRTLPLMMYDEHDVEDLDTSGEDHCLTGDTLVLTDKGYVEIQNLVGTTGMVMSHDGKYHHYGNVRMTRKGADILTVELEDGTIIKCTEDHRFMLPDGSWVRARDLAAGMEVKTLGDSSHKQHDSEV